MKITDPLPEPFASLVQTIKANHPESSGDNRAAVAELEARSALASDDAAQKLVRATWALVACTFFLFAATVALVLVDWSGSH